jgi:hypothetical protein
MEDNPSAILTALEEAGLLALFSPALTGPKLNLPGIQRFEKNSRLLPDDPPSRTARLGPFLYALTEKLSPKEKQALIKTTGNDQGRAGTLAKAGERAPRNWRLRCAPRASRRPPRCIRS